MIWGKSRGLDEPYPLLHHLVDAAAAASALWERHLTAGYRAWLGRQLGLCDGDTRRFAALLAGLHDIGKAIPGFQCQWPPAGADGYLGHDKAAYLTLPTLLGGDTRGQLVQTVEYRVGELLGGHHGAYPVPPTRPRDIEYPISRVAALGGPEWHAHREEHVRTVRGLLGDPQLPDRFPAAVATALTGLVILADWIASDEKFIRQQQKAPPTHDLAARYEATVETMRERIAKLGLVAPRFGTDLSFHEVWEFERNPLQQSLAEEFAPTTTGLLTITAPPGLGKTEAALDAARRFGLATGRDGLFIGLPTMATADQMRVRVADYTRKIAPGVPVTLAHSLAAFRSDYLADPVVSEWLNGPKKPLLAGFSVATIDQALVTALATRHNSLRMHALANKTLIVDEAHAYDPYMQALLGRLLTWCGHLGVPVVLLSATLPGHIRQQLTREYLAGAGLTSPDTEPLPYPGWCFTAIDGSEQRPRSTAVVQIRDDCAREARIERVAHERDLRARQDVINRHAHQAITNGGCLAVVCNTVATAQETYRQLREAVADEVPMWLLHSRFPQHQRQALETEITTRFGKNSREHRTGIVVATQVIEQSLDIDFDLVVSDLAPAAQLIQRLGRCHRHPRGRRPDWCAAPTIVVLDPIDLDSDLPCPSEWTAIYSPYELLATHRALAARDPRFRVPEDVDPLVQQVHDLTTPDLDDSYADLWAEHYVSARAQAALAAVVAIPRPGQVSHLHRLTRPDITDTDASTRLGIDTVRVIPRYTGSDGRIWLDPEHTAPFPTGWLKSRQVKRVINYSIMAPASYTRRLAPAPETWRKTILREARILNAPTDGGLTVDPELGLVKDA